jgi:hypothetical protein
MNYAELPVIAREAYAHGWARSGGPMTPRVQLGCAVAVALACERPDAPDVLEATLKLGSLEGTWAAIYARREKLTAVHVAKVTKAYRALLAKLDVASAIKALQAAIPTTEATQPDPHRAEIETAATVEARRLLHSVTDDTSAVAYSDTGMAISAALLDGEAEGVAGGVALIVRTTATVGVDFDLAFADAHDALGQLGDHWGDAQGWLGRVINGTATDLGNALSSAALAGGDYDALRDAATGVLDGEEIRSVETLIDLAMSQAFSTGALSIYAREGVTTADFVTAGGSRVCPLCMNAEAGNPWALIECPRPGLHPYCRCAISPSANSVLSVGANIARYLVA